MIILGIDPGTNYMGWGVIKYEGNTFTPVAYDVVNMKKEKYLPEVLRTIYDTLRKVIKEYEPDSLSVENAFYGLNVDAVLKIGYARGAALLAGVHSDLNIGEYSPREVKKAVTGKGAATKDQVQYMVKTLLNLQENMKYDASDALALAICHALKQTSAIPSSGKNWGDFIKNNPERIIE